MKSFSSSRFRVVVHADDASVKENIESEWNEKYEIYDDGLTHDDNDDDDDARVCTTKIQRLTAPCSAAMINYHYGSFIWKDRLIDRESVNGSALQFYFSMWQNGMLHQRFICSPLLCRKLSGENTNPCWALGRMPRSQHGFYFRFVSAALITFDNSLATTQSLEDPSFGRRKLRNDEWTFR